MKSYWMIFAAIFMIVLTACGASTSEVQPASVPADSISGVLKDGNNPVAEAKLNLFDNSMDKNDPAAMVAETLTDASGAYAFDGIKPGNYTLMVTISKPTFGELPCKSTGAFALQQGVFAQNMAFQLDDGSGLLIINIQDVSLSEGTPVEKNINIINCQ